MKTSSLKIEKPYKYAKHTTAAHQNYLPDKDIALKSTQTFLTTSCELHIYIEPFLSPFLRVEISLS